jgi:acetyl-CoA C-acetyltransferase
MRVKSGEVMGRIVSAMPGSVIVGGARTPIGKLLGVLSGFPAVDLGGLAIGAALTRAGLPPDAVDYVIMGQVLQAGAGQITARQAAVKAGLPMSTPALTINKVCLSGLDAIALADQLISAGEFDIVVAGGMESMSNAPHLVPGARRGFKFGDATLVDSMAYDGLFCAFDQCAMGESTERYNAKLGIGREEQDEFSLRSHELAALAQKNGAFDDEVVPVAIPQRRGEPLHVTLDEGVRADTTLEGLAALRPAFAADGTITAGSASQISDGACAVVVASRAAAERYGLEPLADIGYHGVVAGPDASLQAQPANAIAKALDRAGQPVSALDLVEINEAFASVAVYSARQLELPWDRLNVNGGAIALGHPIGASGARLALTLALELRRRGGGLGAAALCGGGGQGDALLLNVH